MNQNPQFLEWFSVFISITAPLLFLYLSITWFNTHRQEKKRLNDILKQAEKRIPIYRVSIFNLDQHGQISWMVGVKEFDSIFKVAQYAPDNFKEWSGGWNNLYEGDDVREFIRYYVSDSGNGFAIVVRIPNTIGNEKAISYLLHL